MDVLSLAPRADALLLVAFSSGSAWKGLTAVLFRVPFRKGLSGEIFDGVLLGLDLSSEPLLNAGALPLWASVDGFPGTASAAVLFGAS